MKFLRLAMVLAAVAAAGQTPTTPAQPADARNTPRGAVFGFLEDCQAGDYARASSYLDLSRWSASHREQQGAEAARQLKAVLDRKLTSSFAKLSTDPAGTLLDGLPEDRELLGRVSLEDRQVDLYLNRVERDGRRLWLVSSDTVALLPKLYEDIGNSAIEERLPSVLVEHTFMGGAPWQWLGLLLLALAASAIGRLAAWVVLRVVRPFIHRTASTIDDALLEVLGPPVRLLAGIVLFRIGLVWMAPPALWRAYLQRILGMLVYVAVAWLLARLVDLGGRQYVAAMAHKGKVSAGSVVPLARRSLKVLVVAGAVLASLELWGYNTTTLLTGLGIGGVAIALAAQKTIENLFGGVALISDQPVKVGDVCKFGDRVGTIEDIGLRSTRIRTPERTVVSVPNGQFSSMSLENVSSRDRILFNPKFPLRRETTTAQIRRLLERVDGILGAHPLILPGGKRVRFNGVGPYSHDLEVFAYVQTKNADEYLGIQEELQLAILDAIEEEGTGLAVPPK